MDISRHNFGWLFDVYTVIRKAFLPIQKTIAKKVKIRLKKFKKVLQLPYLLYYNIKVKFKKPNHKKYEGDEFGKSEQES